ncbi:MAG: 3-phosphoshikimate 1-carboxyvinyltransferase [Desulfurispora sp.]|uniref:3-phosphoshikimate 1-carboxyvinyltransferase n=1 Tax=Desulfurispora sp. TaxID=3014275 RepID=UPI004049BA46
MQVSPVSALAGSVQLPGDKSISHRALMLGAIARGQTVVKNFLPARDCFSTWQCLEQLGVKIHSSDQYRTVLVEGRELHGLQEPGQVLDAGNSGTTIRLLLGLLSGQQFFSVLTGDESLRQRPMQRVVKPLVQMGAHIAGRQSADRAPLAVQGGNLRAISYRLPVASAQLKSALLLAGLYSRGTMEIEEPAPTRDHTERMLQFMEVDIQKDGNYLRLNGGQQPVGREICVPGDISAAAFFLVAAACLPGSRLVCRDVGLNPARTGVLDVLQQMGARLEIRNMRMYGQEPVGDIYVESGQLQAVVIAGESIPRLIDEIPALAIAAARASGVSVIRDAAELRVKESDRISSVVKLLTDLGVKVQETANGMIIYGTNRPFQPAELESYGDHRIAMAGAIAGLMASAPVTVRQAECVAISFPNFENILHSIRAQ